MLSIRSVNTTFIRLKKRFKIKMLQFNERGNEKAPSCLRLLISPFYIRSNRCLSGGYVLQQEGSKMDFVIYRWSVTIKK